MSSIIVLLIGNIDYDSRVQKEISSLISLGYHVTLVVWSGEPISYNKENVDIVELNLSGYKEPRNTFSKHWKILKFWFKSARIVKNSDYKYIHCNDINTLGVLFFLPKKYRTRVVYDAHELYPEMYKTNGIKYKFWTFLEKYLIRKIDNIITPELHRADYLKLKYKLKRMPYVVNNFPIYQELTPLNMRNSLNLSKEKKILCYQGKIAKRRQIENIIESLIFLPESFILVLIGYTRGNYMEELKQFIVNKGLEDRVFFYGTVQPGEMLQTIAGCDISIALYGNDTINNYLCASNKVFDSIMAGVKVITNDYPPHRTLKNYEFVSLISDSDPRTIAECAINLDERDSIIPEDMKQKFSWDSFHEIFKQIYQ